MQLTPRQGLRGYACDALDREHRKHAQLGGRCNRVEPRTGALLRSPRRQQGPGEAAALGLILLMPASLVRFSSGALMATTAELPDIDSAASAGDRVKG